MMGNFKVVASELCGDGFVCSGSFGRLGIGSLGPEDLGTSTISIEDSSKGTFAVTVIVSLFAQGRLCVDPFQKRCKWKLNARG